MGRRRKTLEEKRKNRIAQTVREQAKRSRNLSRYVIVVDRNGHVIYSWRNEDYKLNVITVIGPYCDSDIKVDFSEAILLEIGIRKLYPYCRADGSSSGRGVVSQRQQHATATLLMIWNFWPTLMDILLFHAHEMTAHWKRQSHQTGVRSAVVSSGETLHCERLTGVRFSIKHTSFWSADQILFASVLQSERIARQVPLDIDLGMRADLLCGYLSSYGEHLFTREWFQRELHVHGGKNKLSLALEIIESRDLLPHQWAILFEKFKGRSCEELFYIALNYASIEIDYDLVSRWDGKLIEKNIPLFPCEDLYIWITPRRYNSRLCDGPSNRDKNIVFEVIPKHKLHERDDQQLGNLFHGAKTIPYFLWNHPDHRSM